MSRFNGKVALVTGASSGIGEAVTRRLVDDGALVFTAQRRPLGGTTHIAADLMDDMVCDDVVRQVIAQAGRLDILINNAGLMREGTVEESSVEDWHASLHLNLTVPFLLTKAAMPHLRAAKGSIVNTGSIEGLGSNPRHPAYCAAKAGLHGLTRAVAVDHGPDGVRCNAVAPGWIDTPLNVDFINSLDNPDAFRDKIGDIHPVGRTGSPDEVAGLICWLASDEAAFVTGQVWTIDGGRTAKLSLP
ncbi:MAG: SDR family NAD(P)-dependent oxidoreductase [Paracoccaceae bacterium]|nr:SDR family NAD(P)-dependent oxidoreductase [Paracoccaceae bacterium]